MRKFLAILWKIVKFLLNIVKHIFLFTMYCSMPDKYSGVTYSEWLQEDNKNENK